MHRAAFRVLHLVLEWSRVDVTIKVLAAVLAATLVVVIVLELMA